MPRSHREHHRTDRIGWLRASVLGANDGIVSTASLLLGAAAANAAPGDVMVAGSPAWLRAPCRWPPVKRSAWLSAAGQAVRCRSRGFGLGCRPVKGTSG